MGAKRKLSSSTTIFTLGHSDRPIEDFLSLLEAHQSDALIARKFRVEHILSLTRNQLHKITPWAKVRGTTIAYRTNSKGTMAKTLKVGDHVSWNSEAGRVRGHIIKKITRPTHFKGYVHHATATHPQYMIKSDRTDHIALHHGPALRKLKT